jgi:hypothetical protein
MAHFMASKRSAFAIVSWPLAIDPTLVCRSAFKGKLEMTETLPNRAFDPDRTFTLPRWLSDRLRCRQEFWEQE